MRLPACSLASGVSGRGTPAELDRAITPVPFGPLLLYNLTMDRAEVLRRLRQNHAPLAALGVKRAYLFGSYARDSGTAGTSDVDIMVDLDEGPNGRKMLFSAFDVGAIQFALTQILDCPVDLVIRSDALKPGRRLRMVAETGLVDVF